MLCSPVHIVVFYSAYCSVVVICGCNLTLSGNRVLGGPTDCFYFFSSLGDGDHIYMHTYTTLQ
jgi:hypothetical protein